MERTVHKWEDVVPYFKPEIQEKCTPEIIASMNEQFFDSERKTDIADYSYVLGNLTCQNTACHAGLRVNMSKMPYLFNGIIRSTNRSPTLKRACNIFLNWMVSEDNPAWAETVKHALIFRNKEDEVTAVIWPDTSIIPMVQTVHFCIMTRECGEHTRGLANFCHFYDDPDTGNGDPCLSWLLSRAWSTKPSEFKIQERVTWNYQGYHGAYQPNGAKVPIPFIKGPAEETRNINTGTWHLTCNAAYMVWDKFSPKGARNIQEFIAVYRNIKEMK